MMINIQITLTNEEVEEAKKLALDVYNASYRHNKQSLDHIDGRDKQFINMIQGYSAEFAFAKYLGISSNKEVRKNEFGDKGDMVYKGKTIDVKSAKKGHKKLLVIIGTLKKEYIYVLIVAIDENNFIYKGCIDGAGMSEMPREKAWVGNKFNRVAYQSDLSPIEKYL